VVKAAGQGSFDLVRSADILFNNALSDGVANLINSFFHVSWVSGPMVVSVAVLLVFYYKWGSIIHWFGTIGSYVILSAVAYIILKGMGIL